MNECLYLVHQFVVAARLFQRDLLQRGGIIGQVAVRVNESGHQRASGQVHFARTVRQRLHLGPAAHGRDRSVFH